MTSSSQSLLAALADRGRVLTSTEAATIGEEDLRLGRKSVADALQRLTRDGLLQRVRRGTYIVTSPGLPPLHAFVIASALTEDGVVSGWAALHHHGLTEQIPRVTEVMTAHRVRDSREVDGRGLITFEGARFEILHVVRPRMFGIETVWFDNQRARVLDKERAVLELFIRPRPFGGIETVLELFESHGKELDLEKLTAHALSLGTASVCKRVGWVLEETGADARVLTPLLSVPATGYSLLDPSRAPHGPRRTRWHLRENLGPKR